MSSRICWLVSAGFMLVAIGACSSSTSGGTAGVGGSTTDAAADQSNGGAAGQGQAGSTQDSSTSDTGGMAGQAGSGQAGSGQAGSGQAGSGQAGSGEAGSAGTGAGGHIFDGGAGGHVHDGGASDAGQTCQKCAQAQCASEISACEADAGMSADGGTQCTQILICVYHSADAGSYANRKALCYPDGTTNTDFDNVWTCMTTNCATPCQ